MSTKGYYIYESNGTLVEKVDGTRPRSFFNKHRARRRIVKRIEHVKTTK